MMIHPFQDLMLNLIADLEHLKDQAFWCCSAIFAYLIYLESFKRSSFLVWLVDLQNYDAMGFIIMYCFSPVSSLSISAFYGLYVYGDVWNSIGWSLWNPPCIQSIHVALDQASFYTKCGFRGCFGYVLSFWLS